LLASGLIDFSRLGGIEVASVLSVGGTAFLKVILGVFLMIAGINPDAVGMIIKVFIRGQLENGKIYVQKA